MFSGKSNAGTMTNFIHIIGIITLFVVILKDIRVNAGCVNSLCDWEPWDPWSDCSLSCGGGYKSRYRGVCCISNISFENCLRSCGKDTSGYHESTTCNELCYHGGTYMLDHCLCPETHTGSCCSEGEIFNSLIKEMSNITKLLLIID